MPESREYELYHAGKYDAAWSARGREEQAARHAAADTRAAEKFPAREQQKARMKIDIHMFQG